MQGDTALLSAPRQLVLPHSTWSDANILIMRTSTPPPSPTISRRWRLAAVGRPVGRRPAHFSPRGDCARRANIKRLPLSKPRSAQAPAANLFGETRFRLIKMGLSFFPRFFSRCRYRFCKRMIKKGLGSLLSEGCWPSRAPARWFRFDRVKSGRRNPIIVSPLLHFACIQ